MISRARERTPQKSVRMEGPSELTRTTLAVLFVGGLIATSFWILWPFLPAVIWATTLVVATWPIMLRVQRRLWNKRGLAIAVMTIALLVIFVLPFWLAIATITQHFDRIAELGDILGGVQAAAAAALVGRAPVFRRSRRPCSGRMPRPAASSRWSQRRRPTPAARPPGSSARWAASGSCSCSSC